MSSVLQIAVFTLGARVCLRVPLCVQQHSLSKEVARPLNPTYTQGRKTQTDAQQTRSLFDQTYAAFSKRLDVLSPGQ